MFDRISSHYVTWELGVISSRHTSHNGKNPTPKTSRSSPKNGQKTKNRGLAHLRGIHIHKAAERTEEWVAQQVGRHMRSHSDWEVQ